MEVVGTVASLVQLVDTALSIAKTSKELHRSYREAPTVTKSVENQRLLLQSVVQEYIRLRPSLDPNGSGSNPLPLDTRQTIAAALRQVSEALQQLKLALDYREDGRSRATSRMRWAFSVKTAVKEAQEQLEISKSTLTNCLLLLSIRLSVQHQSTLEVVAAALNEPSNPTPLPQKPTEDRTMEIRDNFAEPSMSAMVSSRRKICFANDSPQHSSIEKSFDIKAYITSDPAAKISRVPRSKTMRLFAPEYGISGFVSLVSDCNKSTYSLSLRTKLPWWLGCRALTLEWRVRRFVSSWLNLTILPGCFSLRGSVSKDSLIAQACFRGDEAMTQKLLSEGKADPNDLILDWDWTELLKRSAVCVPKDREITILAVAIISRNLSLTRYLLDIGANVNSIFSSMHMSPLQMAALCGNLEMMRLLITRGALLDHVAVEGLTVLPFIGLSVTTSFVQAEIDKWGWSAFAGFLHTSIEALRGYGYCFIATESMYSDWSWYHSTLAFCDAETIAFMIQRGELLLKNSGPDDFVLDEVARFRNKEVLEALEPYYTKPQLNKALISTTSVIVKNRYWAGWELNIDKRLANLCDFVEALLKNGASIEAADKYNRTALHFVSRDGATDCARLLLDHGANTEAKDRDNCTPLHCACRMQATDCVKLLLEHGADTEAKDKYGRTPLHNASIKRFSDCVKLLLEYGASTDAKDNYKRTALHWQAYSSAFSSNCADILALLLEHGSNLHALDCDRRTPLELLLCASTDTLDRFPMFFGESLSHLLRHGADPTRSMPVMKTSRLDDKENLVFTGMNRIEDYLIQKDKKLDLEAFYYKTLHDIYPEIIIDTEGTVYWDAKEQLEGPAQGSCWQLPG